MTTGDYLVQHSTLQSGTALAHLLALQAGTSQGTVFAAMFALRCDEPRLTLVQRRAAGEWVEHTPHQVGEGDGRLTVLTGIPRLAALLSEERMTVVTQRAASAVVQRDVQSAVVRNRDVLQLTLE